MIFAQNRIMNALFYRYFQIKKKLRYCRPIHSRTPFNVRNFLLLLLFLLCQEIHIWYWILNTFWLVLNVFITFKLYKYYFGINHKIIANITHTCFSNSINYCCIKIKHITVSSTYGVHLICIKKNTVKLVVVFNIFKLLTIVIN